MASDLNVSYILVGRNLSRLLAENDLDLSDLLYREDPGLSVSQASNPATALGRTKDLGTVLISAAVLVVALTPLLLRAIGRLTARPVLVVERLLVPIEDSTGQVVRGADNEPVLEWVDRVRYVERGGSDVSATVKALGVEIEIGLSDHEE